MTSNCQIINGKRLNDFRVLRAAGVVSMTVEAYRDSHITAEVKEAGREAACKLAGKSKATLGRFSSDATKQDDRFMAFDVVTQPKSAARGYAACLRMRKSATWPSTASIRLW